MLRTGPKSLTVCKHHKHGNAILQGHWEWSCSIWVPTSEKQSEMSVPNTTDSKTQEITWETTKQINSTLSGHFYVGLTLLFDEGMGLAVV